MPTKSKQPDDKAPDKPHYHGHRERLRERFRSAGPDALADYELLEMILFSTRRQGDTEPAAKALLERFGSLAQVIHAPEVLLREIDGIGEVSVHLLKLIAANTEHIAKGEIKRSVGCRRGTT